MKVRTLHKAGVSVHCAEMSPDVDGKHARRLLTDVALQASSKMGMCEYMTTRSDKTHKEKDTHANSSSMPDRLTLGLGATRIFSLDPKTYKRPA